MVKIELVSLILVNLIANIWYSILLPFLPIELNKHNVEVSVYGYIFAMYALAVMVSSAIAGKMLTLCGRKLILIIGLLSMGVSLLGFGMIDYFGEAFVVPSALILRTFQGLSSGLIQTTSYAIIAVIYPDEQQKYLGILETSMGFGWVIGPLVGAVLYSMIEFQGTFYLIGLIFLISGVALIFIVPKTVDLQDEKKSEHPIGSTENVILENSSQPEHRIRYIDVFRHRVFTLTSIVAFFGYFGYSYLEPVLAVRLMDFEISEFWIGAFFSLGAVGYIVGGLTFTCVTQYISKRVLIVSGMFMAGLWEFMIGPSLFLPNSLAIMCVGNFSLGLMTIYFQVTALPEMIDDLVKIYPTQRYEWSDISAGVFNSMLGFGQMIAPLYGSYMTDYYGFRFTADTVGLILIGYSLLYYILWVGFVTKKEKEDSFSWTPTRRISVKESIMEAYSVKSLRKNKPIPSNGSTLLKV